MDADLPYYVDVRINGPRNKENYTMASDFEQVRSEVVDAGGIKCFPMQELRDASPYRKLGPGVNAEISASLHQKSLEHSELPLYQHEPVYVYEQGSAPAMLVNAVTGQPSTGGAEAILAAVAPADDEGGAESKLDEVKALVVQLNDVFETVEA